MPQFKDGDPRVLLLIADARSVEMIHATLLNHGHEPFICEDVTEVCGELNHQAGALIVAKEDLSDLDVKILADCFAHQPTWSRLPLIVVLPEGEEISLNSLNLDPLEKTADMTMLESPLQLSALVRAVRAAFADRARQLELRDLSAELKQLRRAKTDFLANVSHEIRTPLGAILGFTELMIDPKIPLADKKEYMTAVRRNGLRLSALIDDILDLSRVETGSLEMEKMEFSLQDLLVDVIREFKPRAAEKGLSIEMKLAEDLEPILGDPIRLKQVLVHVVGNAIKFTSHGRIELRLSFQSTPLGQKKLHIEVEDTGTGIPAEHVANLFDPFSQVDASTTRKFGGAGLGLALSRRLVRAMGGDLELKWSIPGGGSVFSIQLPILESDSKLPLAGNKILVVDDSLDNQILLGRILKLLGAEVAVADDGLDGVQMALDGQYNVVLMDLQMPRMGGVEATCVLRARGYLTPIVALTARSLNEDRQRALSVGCTDYLTKPVQRSRLVQVIERVSQRNLGSAK